MKSVTHRHLIAALIFGTLTVPFVVSADGDKKHEAPAVSSEKEEARTIIPATTAEIWTKIDAEVVELDKTVASGKLSDVHHHAFTVRDLVAALPERSKSLPADKLSKVKGNVKFVATLAKRLDAAGDANDKVATQSGITQLKKVLGGIRANY